MRIKVPGEKARKAVVVILVLIYFMRIINLDQDLPPWGVGVYQPADEGAYAMLAINEQNFGVINPINPKATGMEYGSYTPPSLRTNILGNLCSYIGLTRIGDNYYGLRLPYVLFGFINLMLFLLTLDAIRKKYGTGRDVEKWIVVGALFCMVTDFSFYLASRTVEPSLVRMMFSLLIFLTLIKLPNSYRLRFLLLGFLITTSVFLIYITNLFFYLAMGLTLLYILKSKGRNTFLIATCYFILGCLPVYVLSDLYFHSIWHTSVLSNMYYSITDFAGMQGYKVTGVTSVLTLKLLLKGIIRYFSANYLLYNIPILSLFLISVPIVIFGVLKKKDISSFFLLGSVMSFLLQTIASEDYITRKFLVVSPYFVYLLFLSWFYRKEFLEFMSAKFKNTNLRTRKNLIVLYLFFAGAFCISAVFFRLSIVRDGTTFDFSKADKLLIIGLGLVPTLIIIAKTIHGIYTNKINNKTIKYGLIIILSSAAVLNISLITKYSLASPTFTERDAMIKLANIVNGKYVVGNYQIGYTLYNTMIPIVENENVYSTIMEKDNKVLYLDYEDKSPGMRNYFDNEVFNDSQYTAVSIYDIRRGFQTSGEIRDMNLYKVALKRDFIRSYRKDYIQKEKEYKQKKQQLLRMLDALNSDQRGEKAKIENELRENEKTIGYNAYPDIYHDIVNDVVKEVDVDIHGNIYGNIKAPIYGDIYGNIYGDVEEEIKGHVYGKIYGKTIYSSEGDVSR